MKTAIIAIIILALCIWWYITSSRASLKALEGFQAEDGGASNPLSKTCQLITSGKEHFIDAINKAKKNGNTEMVEQMELGLSVVNDQLVQYGCAVTS